MKKSRVFLLVTMLITFIMLFSFGVLYLVLPQVYFYTKNLAISNNTKLLTDDLLQASRTEECISLISEFSKKNNAIVFAFDQNGEIISEMSSITFFMSGGPRVHLRVSSSDHSPGVTISRTQIDLGDGPMVQMEQDDIYTMQIEREIGSELISRIIVSSMFQPISEAKSVLLFLIPFLLLLDILLGLMVAYLYLRREEQYAQNKTDFMRAAHHELKTPIAALAGITEGMIDNVGVYKNRDEYLLRSKEIIDRLTLLTNDVLNATQSMNQKISKEQLDVGELFDEVMAEYQFLFADKPLIYRPFSYTCRTNRLLLQNVFSNLLSNAARYSTGKITVSFNRNTLAIENQCEPIEEADLAKIFEPFYTISQSRDKSQCGNGIGLYIVKRNLEALKYSFTMKNNGNGVIFEIFF